MSVRLLFTAHEAAQASAAVGGYEIGVGRAVPTVAAVLGLVSVIVGGWVLARPTRRSVAVVALLLGLTSAAVGGLHAVRSAGGLGSGNGLAGALVALVLGLVGTVLAGLALGRSRRVVAGSDRGPDLVGPGKGL